MSPSALPDAVPALDPELDALIRALPKVELHLHLVGSASPAIVAALAARMPGTTVPTDPDGVAALYAFTDFAHFIDVYATVNDLVRTGGDVADVLTATAGELAAQQVRYAEITVTPFCHEQAGLAHGELLEGLADARRRAAALGVELAWVYDIPGQFGAPAATATLRWALDEPPDGLVGFGLGGAELGVDRRAFAAEFAQARAAGLASVPHAGEADGPASVWAALDDLGAVRIGHGVRSVEDPELVAALVERGTTLEVCPTSNVCTQVVPDLAHHPVGALLAAGIAVTLATDDPPMFGTTLVDEHRAVAATCGLDAAAVVDLVRTGVRASCLPADRRRALLAEVDAVGAGRFSAAASTTPSAPRRSPAGGAPGR
jgi:aminodeoxyfutalosine deaminase